MAEEGNWVGGNPILIKHSHSRLLRVRQGKVNQNLAVLVGGSGAHVVRDIHLSDDWRLTLLPSEHNLDVAVATRSGAKTAVQRDEAGAEQQIKCLKGSKAALPPRRKLLRSILQ